MDNSDNRDKQKELSNMKLDYQYYLDHLQDFYTKYANKYLAIKNREVIGVYDSIDEAVTTVSQREAIGTFIVQKSVRSIEEITAHFAANVTI